MRLPHSHRLRRRAPCCYASLLVPCRRVTPSLSPCDSEYTRPWKMKHEICNVRATVRALLRSLSLASPARFTPHSCHKQCSLNSLWNYPTRTNASHPRLTTSVDRRVQTMERPVYLDPNSPGDYPTEGRKFNIHQPPGAPQRHMLTETLHANPCLVAGPGAGCSGDELTPVSSCDFEGERPHPFHLPSLHRRPMAKRQAAWQDWAQVRHLVQGDPAAATQLRRQLEDASHRVSAECVVWVGAARPARGRGGRVGDIVPAEWR